MIRKTLALLLALALVALFAVPGLAASQSPTADLTAGPPPAGSWMGVDTETGALTAADIYGSQSPAISGFGDAYRRAWSGANLVLVDRLERFTSVLWAAVRFGSSSGAASASSSHASYKKLPDFTTYAYETTDPADAQGFIADSIVFSKGDYIAVVQLAAKGSIPHDVLMEQASRQLALLPMATAEYQSVGYGIILGGAGFLIVLAALIVGIVLLARRRRPAVPAFATTHPPVATGVQFSPDGRHWWNGQTWQDAELSVPPGSPRSPDGGYWWDGARWRPMPPGAR
ncbi:MAG: hypothetical protein M3Z98_07105 [Candidatus Dormibacteraeota bacterium]|nr:hypothetical protein [Candidatus Dormibacteraeota bacterium]